MEDESGEVRGLGPGSKGERGRWRRQRFERPGAPLGWAFAAFAAVGLLGGGWRGAARALGPGPAALWVRDRGAQTDFALDADGIVVGRRPCLDESVPSVPPLPSGLVEQLASMGIASVSAALDDREWGRARPACWLLVAGPLALRRGETLSAGRFLERWVHTGSPVRWQRAFRLRLPWRARALASDEHGVWVGAARRCALRWYGHDGFLHVDEELQDADGIEALAVIPEGGGAGAVWAAAGGALVRLDEDGQRMPGQGGFAHVVAIQYVDP